MTMAHTSRAEFHEGHKGRSFQKHWPNPCYAAKNREKLLPVSGLTEDLLNIPQDDRTVVGRYEIPARDGIALRIPARGILRIEATHGAQVGDVNIWNANDPKERLYTSKTRQMHATHLSKGDSLWSGLPYMRPLMTVIEDTVAYGIDEDNAGVHDVIGSRCDPYTHKMLTGETVQDTCHSNLVRAVRPYGLQERDVHDVFNVFMCTGFMRDSGVYFSKPSPVVKGDFVDLFAHVDVLVAVSACRQGDVATACGDMEAKPRCYPLGLQVMTVADRYLRNYVAPRCSSYDGNHGIS